VTYFIIFFVCLTASGVKWSEVLVTDPEVRVRFPALPDFPRSSGSGTGPIKSKIENLLERKSSGSGIESYNTDVGIRHGDHMAPSIRKSWH
jgi:hypothetical protein